METRDIIELSKKLYIEIEENGINRNICRNICKMKCCQLWNKFVTDGIFIYKLFNFFQNNL